MKHLKKSPANRYIDVQFDIESLIKDKTYVKYSLQNDKVSTKQTWFT